MFEAEELVRAELGRHDWGVLRCGCGDSAEHLPLMFEAVIGAGTPRDMIGYTLDNHLELNGNLFEAAVPAVGVLLAALAGELSPPARSHFLTTLWRLAGGESHATETARGRADLGEQCRAAAGEGLWLLLRIGLTGDAEDAETVADLCELVDRDSGRSTRYRTLLHRRAAAGTKRRRRR